MVREQFVSLALCLSLFLQITVATTEASEVVILTDQNFDELTSKGKWLVDFYAPWCGHCKRLSPVLDEASLKLKEEGVELTLSKIDCTVETGVCGRYNIRGFPTLKYFKGGSDSAYSGGRSLDAILTWAKTAAGPPVQDVQDISKFYSEKSVSFVLANEDAAGLEIFQKVAEKIADTTVQFGKTSQLENQLESNYEFQVEKKSNLIVLLRDGPVEVYDGPLDEEPLLSWVKERRFNLVTRLDSESWGPVTSSGKIVVVAIVNEVAKKITEPILENMRDIALDFKNEIIFGYIDGVKFPGIISQYKLSGMPSMVVLDPDNGSHYPFNSTDDFDTSNLKINLKKILSGEISPSYLSEPGVMDALNLLWEKVPLHYFLMALAAVVVLGSGLAYLVLKYVDAAPAKPIHAVKPVKPVKAE